MFNPFEFQFLTTFSGLQDDWAILNLKNGTINEEIKIPFSLLPKEIQIGNEFIIQMLPSDTAKTNEFESLRKLLQDLIS